MSVYPEWAVKHRKPGTSIHRIKGYYYLYEASSYWDSVAKKTKRRSGKCLGRITEQGYQPSEAKIKKPKLGNIDLSKPIIVKEYGVSHFIEKHLDGYIKELAVYFPVHWKTIVMLAYSRLVHQSAINMMPFHIENSYLSVLWSELKFTSKGISTILADIGRNRDIACKFMKSGLGQDEHLLIDMTNLPSKSGRIALAKSGYNSNWDFETQFNLLYIYSVNLKMPMFYRVVPGNIKEVTAMATTVKESGAVKCVVVGDKGFYSKANASTLEDEGLSYIFPMKRDNSIINYKRIKGEYIKTSSNFFFFEKRHIWYTSYQPKDSEATVYLFLDESLRLNEEKDYLNRIESKCENYDIEGYHKKKHTFGTIAIITNLKNTTANGIYTGYKTRMSIEGVFDAYKSVLEADRTYMQNEDVLQGWLFINHVAVQWYYQIYHLLVQEDLIKKYSVMNLIEHLKEMRVININQTWIKAEVIKATDALLSKLTKPVT